MSIILKCVFFFFKLCFYGFCATDGMKHLRMRVLQWSQAIVKMNSIVTTIEGHGDKPPLQRRKNKPNAMLPEGKTTHREMKVRPTMNTKGVCYYLFILIKILHFNRVKYVQFVLNATSLNVQHN